MADCPVPRVKICGITRPEDARHAAECGADALGFVLYAGSPRYVDPEKVRQIIAGLPPMVTTVGLFVNETPARIRKLVEFCRLDRVQLHGDESPGLCSELEFPVIKALRLRDSMTEETFAAYRVSALLLDAYVPDRFGGTGQRCDWNTAAKIAPMYRVVLAGGLTPDNVAEAVRQVRPYAVDVSSGVEETPGVKDPVKVAGFIRAAKEVCQ